MNITSGKIPSAKKVVIYGTEGIGKSALASQFPDPVFIDTEGSTKEMDVRRFEKPTSWEMLKEQVRFAMHSRPCKTLVIDTFDWAEQLCIDHICAQHHKNGIEDFGYGSGYVYEKEEIGRFLNLLSDAVNSGIHVVLTAHAMIRKFEQPDEMGSYDRYEMKLGKKTTNLIAPMVKEWADLVLFCNYKTFAVAVDEAGKKHKAQGGQRVMYTSHHPCWDAKNRYNLSDELPMEYEQIRHILEEQIEPTAPMPAVTAVHRAAPTGSALDDAIEQDEGSAMPVSADEIPKALADLMQSSGITEAQIRRAVGARGYFPEDMPVKDYPKDFIDGALIGAWEQVKSMIYNMEDLPF